MDLHKRLALRILSHLGGSPFKILCGFMLASAFLSMWMSNTATAMMMLPIVFSYRSFGRNTWGAKVKEVYDNIVGGIWMLYWRNYISGNLLIFLLSGF
jgi:di/tricarboxylate transporter